MITQEENQMLPFFAAMNAAQLSAGFGAGIAVVNIGYNVPEDRSNAQSPQGGSPTLNFRHVIGESSLRMDPRILEGHRAGEQLALP